MAAAIAHCSFDANYYKKNKEQIAYLLILTDRRFADTNNCSNCFFNCSLLGKYNLYCFANMVLLFSGSVNSTTVLFSSLHRKFQWSNFHPAILFSDHNSLHTSAFGRCLGEPACRFLNLVKHNISINDYKKPNQHKSYHPEK